MRRCRRHSRSRCSDRRGSAATASRWRSTRARPPRCSPTWRWPTARARARRCASCCGPTRIPSTRAARCGARCRRCARRSARSGSTPAPTASRCATARARVDVAPLPGARGRDVGERWRAPSRSSAASCWRGSALRDSPEFDAWYVARGRRAAARARRGARPAGAGAGGRRRRTARRSAHARRWLALDPLHEPAHRELIRLYALDGDRAAALAQYRDCVRTLSQELGVGPVDETAGAVRAGERGNARRRRAAAPPRRRAGRRARARPSCRSPAAPPSSAALVGAHAAAAPDGRARRDRGRGRASARRAWRAS